MPTPLEYREFALECLRWAEDAKDAGQRETLIGLARLWMQTASEMDRGIIAVEGVKSNGCTNGAANSTRRGPD